MMGGVGLGETQGEGGSVLKRLVCHKSGWIFFDERCRYDEVLK